MVCVACLKIETDKVLPAETYEYFGLEPLAVNICQKCQLDIGHGGRLTGVGWQWPMRKVKEKKGTADVPHRTDD